MKKTVISCLLALFCFMFVNVRVNALDFGNDSYILLAGDEEARDEFNNNCKDFSSVLRMGGYIILLVKIAIPLVIIIKSSLNLYKVVLSGNPDDLKKQANKFVIACIAGIVIFFVPTIINTIFNMVDDYDREMRSKSDAYICKQCIFEPFSNTCSEAVENANNVNDVTREK